MPEKPARFDLYPSPELLAALDRWRGTQPGVPPRATAARLLLEEALRAHGFEPTSKAAAPRRPAPQAKTKTKAAPASLRAMRRRA